MTTNNGEKPDTIFYGTPQTAVIALEKLAGISRVRAIITMPDKEQGRHRALTAPPVKTWAERHLPEIPIYQPVKLDADFCNQLKTDIAAPDFALVCAYGKIIPESLFDWPRRKTYNIHYSLLPKHRGASPVQAALRAGDKTSGISIQQINRGLDTGDILWQREIPIDPRWHADDLFNAFDAMVASGIESMPDLLRREPLPLAPQDHALASHCGKIPPEDCLIDWRQPADIIVNQVRALSPKPGAYTLFNGKRLKILRAGLPEHWLNSEDRQRCNAMVADAKTRQAGSIVGACGDFLVLVAGERPAPTSDRLLVVGLTQPDGKAPMTGGAFSNGLPGRGVGITLGN